MFIINADKSIYLTRGDVAEFKIKAKTGDTEHQFLAEDIVRMKVFEKKDCACVVIQKDVEVKEDTTSVYLALTKEDTKIGGIINKPKDYWYEVEVNPDTEPHTIIGYDDEGAKVFRIYPEGGELNE